MKLPERPRRHSSEYQRPLEQHTPAEIEVQNLFATLGNHEGKALLLPAMRNKTVYQRVPVWRQMIDIQGANPIWDISNVVPFNYCKTFRDIGLVANEILDQSAGTFGYVKTPYGERVGDAFSGHILALSEAYPTLSLLEIFGYTSAPATESFEIETPHGVLKYRKRAPIVRLEIFKALSQSSGSTRLIDLAVTLKENPVLIGRHITHLSRLGLVGYKSEVRDHPIVFCQVSSRRSEGEPYVNNDPALAKKVFDLIAENPTDFFWIDRIIDSLFKENPLPQEARKTYQARISTILSRLHQAGFITKDVVYDPFAGISISDEQKALLTRVVNIYKAFLNPTEDFLEEGRVKAQQIIQNPRRVNVLLEKVRRASSNATSNDRETIHKQIVGVVGEYPQGAEMRKIKKQLEEVYGVRLTESSINRLLRDLLKVNKIRREGTKTRFTYFLAE